jgi:hypothetical protein
MPRQFRAGNDKGQKDDPEKCPNDHTRRLMIELPFYNQFEQVIDWIELADGSILRPAPTDYL